MSGQSVHGTTPSRAASAGPVIGRRAGMARAALNPKADVFVASVFPQFLPPEFGPLWRQGLVIALMVAATQAGVYGAVALAAGRLRRWLVASPGATILVGRATGALFLANAGVTLWAGLGAALSP